MVGSGTGPRVLFRLEDGLKHAELMRRKPADVKMPILGCYSGLKTD